jgi:hypothetical protein
MQNPLSGELAGIGMVGDFKHVSLDAHRISVQEGFNIVSVNALAAAIAEPRPDRFKAQGSIMAPSYCPPES